MQSIKDYLIENIDDAYTKRLLQGKNLSVEIKDVEIVWLLFTGEGGKIEHHNHRLEDSTPCNCLTKGWKRIILKFKGSSVSQPIFLSGKGE